MPKPRRRYSTFQSPKANNRGVLGRLIVMVEAGPVSNESPDGIEVTGNTQIPKEIAMAARAWFRMGEYAQLTLTEYLNRMFNPDDYDCQ